MASAAHQEKSFLETTGEEGDKTGKQKQRILCQPIRFVQDTMSSIYYFTRQTTEDIKVVNTEKCVQQIHKIVNTS